MKRKKLLSLLKYYLLMSLLQASSVFLVKATPEQIIPWGIRRVHAPTVWEELGSKGEGIKVAVIDSGIDRTHPDLDDNLKGGVSFVEGKNWWDVPSDPSIAGHGTHCAGIIAAEDNDIGVVGVAPKASLYAVKVDTDSVSFLDQLAQAIYWCVDNGIKVASVSVGDWRIDDPDLRQACDDAYNSGVLLIAASGKPISGIPRWYYPAKYSSVIAVGAVDFRAVRWSGNPTGSKLELMAPGVDINSTDLGGSYSTKAGSSCAAPHVAGLAALVWASHPQWSASQVRQRLCEITWDLGSSGRDDYYGYGLVDGILAIHDCTEIPVAPADRSETHTYFIPPELDHAYAEANPSNAEYRLEVGSTSMNGSDSYANATLFKDFVPAHTITNPTFYFGFHDKGWHGRARSFVLVYNP